ncbi:ketoacyl-ACP synthase III [Rhizobium helianthi]|uniref:Ketoacyl-ACP synthase III n=1 Tax=Rhizobium helianthi TaxID=1132695 RepID=A0ABW4M275_9HYPH
MTVNDQLTDLEQSPWPLITAMGSFIPENRISNVTLGERFGKDRDFIERKLGFTARAVKPASMKTSDMCVRAFEKLEQKHPLDRAQIDLLAVVTQNPDQKIPHVSAIVHHKLGLSRHCATFDISQGCAGYAVGLAAVNGWMTTLGTKNAVLLTCDPYSEIVDQNDPATAMVFGDAATATLVSREGDRGYRLRDALFGTLPDSFNCLTCEDRFFMDGRQVSMNVMNCVPAAIETILLRNGLGLQDLSQIIFHQASLYVVDALRSKLNIGSDMAPFAAASIGNSVSSSIPLLLEQVMASHQKRILICGFGIGFSWSVAILERVER